MVHKKKKESTLKDELERVQKHLGTVVGERWYVYEHTPSRYQSGYYDYWIPEENTRVSDYFSTREEAEAWMNEHEAEKGSELRIRRQELRERVVRQWRNA